MKEIRAKLEKEILERFRSNECFDEEEDRGFGLGNRGDELPEDLDIRERRLAKIREAMEASSASSPKKRGPKSIDPLGIPKDKARRNFTDGDSCTTKDSDNAFIQAYNAQAVVDSESQIMVAADLIGNASDITHLPNTVKQVELNLNRNPREIPADAGYLCEKNVTFLKKPKISAYISPDGQTCSSRAEPAP